MLLAFFAFVLVPLESCVVVDHVIEACHVPRSCFADGVDTDACVEKHCGGGS